MRLKKFLSLITAFVVSALDASAYEVWMGTHLSTSEQANNLQAWALTASQLEGFNVNRAPHDTDPASNNEYRTIFAQFTNARNAMTEFARSQATRDPAKTDELAFPSIAARLEEIFNFENSFGYDLSILMFYDERGTFQGTEYLYEWTETEIQYLRTWLDDNGQADVELMWNVRNNSVRNRELAAHPLVDSVEIEASTTAFLANTNNQRTFFDWFWDNPATANKRIALQLPRVLPGDPLNQFQGTRRVARSLGETIGYGEDGMRSHRLVFLPVTYNDSFPYIPETVSNGASYPNTLTSIALSLIEQRSLFEGRLRSPTIDDADSTTRMFAPTVGSIGDQTVPAATSTGPLAFSVGDDSTDASALTITKTSSNSSLVLDENIILGGSGTDRTVSIIPTAGASGTTEIELWVGDGTLASRVAFTVTVLPPGLIPGTVYSGEADCSITEIPSIEKLTNPTVDVGARGGAPWVERCTVFVFQLPDLGTVSNPFQSATFMFDLSDKNATLRGHDLYGLGRRTSSTVLTSDFYSQNSVVDPSDATRLQQNIMNDSTGLGLVVTSEGGSANLMSYLNEQYAGGAGVGDHVFLRINTREAKSGVNYGTLTMSEGGVSSPQDTRPRISYQAISAAPTITPIPDQMLVVNTSTGALSFTIGDVNTSVESLTLTGTSSNNALVPDANIIFGGSGANRTVTVTPVSGSPGTAEITVQVSDGFYTADTTFSIVAELPTSSQSVVAGWDVWDSNTAPNANVTASGITATATSSTASGNWSTTDDGSSGRGSSGDTTWGSFDGNGIPASSVTSGAGSNMTAFNGATDAEITFTITNNGATDWDLDAFHMDVIAFRSNAPRAYRLEVLSGDITNGVVFTSADDEINDLGGIFSGSNDDHDEIDLDLTGIADSTIEAGGTAVIQIAFSSGTGSGGGHHLFVDNVAVTGVTTLLTGQQSWRYQYFGTTENSGLAADSFDANFDGESNFIEFATGQDPYAATRMQTPVGLEEDFIIFRYNRSKAAMDDGVTYRVEWSDSLGDSSWSTFGITETADHENSGTGDLQSRIATVPIGGTGRRFILLRIDQP